MLQISWPHAPPVLSLFHLNLVNVTTHYLRILHIRVTFNCMMYSDMQQNTISREFHEPFKFAMLGADQLGWMTLPQLFADHISLGWWCCTSYQIRKNYGLRMRRECRERFPRHRPHRKPLLSDPGMHHGTYVLWCMSGSLICGGGEYVPSIPGAYAIRNFTYMVRGPLNGDVQPFGNGQNKSRWPSPLWYVPPPPPPPPM